MGKSVLLNNTLKATKIQAKYHEDATKYSRKVKKYDQQNTSSISLVTPGPLTRHLQVPKSKKRRSLPYSNIWWWWCWYKGKQAGAELCPANSA